MSRSPHPQAVLAAILATRLPSIPESDTKPGPYQIAALVSDIARLGKQATRYGVASCNGEVFPGQHAALCRARLSKAEYEARLSAIQAKIEKIGERLSKATERINSRLAPFGLFLTSQNDPRGHCVQIYETGANAHTSSTVWSI